MVLIMEGAAVKVPRPAGAVVCCKPTLAQASVFGVVWSLPDVLFCRKKIMPSVTHSPVVAVPEPRPAFKREAEVPPTYSFVFVAVALGIDQEKDVSPKELPSGTCMIPGCALKVMFEFATHTFPAVAGQTLGNVGLVAAGVVVPTVPVPPVVAADVVR